MERPGFVGSKEDMWTIADMRARIEASYARKQNRSLKTVQYCFKHLEAAWVIDITTPAVQEYTTKRLQSGAARASINPELPTCAMGLS